MFYEKCPDISVTADGIKAAFSAVESLVQAAPVIDDWTIVAFRQPQGTNFIIEMYGQKIGADDIWFTTEPDGDKTGLYLFIKGLTPENEKATPSFCRERHKWQ